MLNRSSLTTLAVTLALGGAMTISCDDDDDGPPVDGGTADVPVPVGGTGNVPPTGGTGGIDGGQPDGLPPVAATCPQHPLVTQNPMNTGICNIGVAPLAMPLAQSLTLTAGKTYFLTGPLFVGNDTAAGAATLTVQPGVTVLAGEGAYIVVQRYSKIMAVGTATQPIVFTSVQPAGQRGPSDWGGLTINGLAPINSADREDGSAPGEAESGRYGGTMPTDNSGSLKYVRVEFAGQLINETNELNGINFQGVGSGTMVDYVQAHMTEDDAVEFFGGTVNVKHVVITGPNDDGFDWTSGWRGKAQFVVVQKLLESGEESSDPRGIEADGLQANHSAMPYSSPILSNFTIIARAGSTQDGIHLRRGTQAQIWNTIVTGLNAPGWGTCLNIVDVQTLAWVTGGQLVVQNLVLNCPTATANGGITASMRVGANVKTGDPMLTNWIPAATSPAVNIGAGPAGDPFFEAVTYAGAVPPAPGVDWTAGWIQTAKN
jgi:hypothetical protein